MRRTSGANSHAKRRVLVIGGGGLIGRAVTALLREAGGGARYEVLVASRRTTPPVDLEAPASIRLLLEGAGPLDHVVVAAGDAVFGGLAALTRGDLEASVLSKLLGQVEVALAALPRLRDGGSVTLTSGELSHAPIPGSAAVAMVNGALDGFVRAAALDLAPGRRLNVVSPGWIRETRLRMGLPLEPGVPARAIAQLYVDAIESGESGRVFQATGGPAQVVQRSA